MINKNIFTLVLFLCKIIFCYVSNTPSTPLVVEYNITAFYINPLCVIGPLIRFFYWGLVPVNYLLSFTDECPKQGFADRLKFQ